MRVLFADAVDSWIVDALSDRGHTCVVEPTLDEDGLVDRVAGFEALVVRSTRVKGSTIDAADALELIVRAGAGTNTIDVGAAAAVGIYVTNVPGRNAVAVAELTMGLLLSIDRRIPDNVADLRAGRWDKKTYSAADGLYGKTIGVLGLGEIGTAVAERAAAFGLALLGLRKTGRSAHTEARLRSLPFRWVDTVEELVSQADILTIHVPATSQTVGLCDRRLLGLLKPRAILLNTSRGDIVDEVALLEALDRGLRAGLDVYPDEPSAARTEWSSKLAIHPNVVGTHHIGASTAQAQRAIAEGVVEIFDAFAEGRIINCVNLAPSRLGSHTLHVRHYDRVGVLAGIFDLLRRANLNVEQMDNRIFLGSKAAVATIDVAGAIAPELIEALRAIPDVISVSLQ